MTANVIPFPIVGRRIPITCAADLTRACAFAARGARVTITSEGCENVLVLPVIRVERADG
jgi:hypothetical protein